MAARAPCRHRRRRVRDVQAGVLIEPASAPADLDRRIREHFAAIGQDEVAAATIYADDAVLEYVQSGERIRGRASIVASRQAYPGRPAAFELVRIVGDDNVRVAELVLRFEGDEPHPVVAVLDVRDGLVVRERIYIAEPWEAPAYRSQWAEPIGRGSPNGGAGSAAGEADFVSR